MGKTTSLKIVYEVLKRINKEETKVFKYIDMNHYKDFLDVLVLDNALTGDIIDQCLDKPETYSTPKKYDLTNINLSKDEIGIDNNTISLRVNYLDVINQRNHKITSGCTTRVGIDTEGDYGYNQNQPSLYKRLCYLYGNDSEIIICACNKRSKHKPFECIRDFVLKYNASAYFIPVSTGSDMKKAWLYNAASVLWVLRNLI